MRRNVDVPALVSGLILLGFASVSVWLLLGRDIIGPTTMWFAAILMVAGVVGLAVSLSTARRVGRRPAGEQLNMTTRERNPQ